MDVTAESCIGRMRRYNSNLTVTVLTSSDVPHVPGFERLSVQHRSDWARLYTLARRGGVWLDATCLCAAPITAWVDMDADHVQGFLTPASSPKELAPKAPPDAIMENWAFAAPQGNAFMQAWKDEVMDAIATGFASYCAKCATFASPWLKDTGYLPYLTTHLAMRKAHATTGETLLLAPSDKEILGEPSYALGKIDLVQHGVLPLGCLTSARRSPKAAAWLAMYRQDAPMHKITGAVRSEMSRLLPWGFMKPDHGDLPRKPLLDELRGIQRLVGEAACKVCVPMVCAEVLIIGCHVGYTCVSTQALADGGFSKCLDPGVVAPALAVNHW